MFSLERGIYMFTVFACICRSGRFPDTWKLRLKACALKVAWPDRDGVDRNVSLAKPTRLCKFYSLSNFLQAQNPPPTEADYDRQRPQIIKIFTKNTGCNLILAGPASRNESAAASKGGGKNVARMNVNPAAGLDPLVMTLRLKELAQTVLNWVAMSQTASSPAGCLSLTLPSWHCHLQQLCWDFSRPDLSRPRFHSYIRITCRSCVSFSTNWAKGNQDLKGRGWININQISSLWGWVLKNLCALMRPS